MITLGMTCLVIIATTTPALKVVFGLCRRYTL